MCPHVAILRAPLLSLHRILLAMHCCSFPIQFLFHLGCGEIGVRSESVCYVSTGYLTTDILQCVRPVATSTSTFYPIMYPGHPGTITPINNYTCILCSFSLAECSDKSQMPVLALHHF